MTFEVILTPGTGILLPGTRPKRGHYRAASGGSARPSPPDETSISPSFEGSYSATGL